MTVIKSLVMVLALTVFGTVFGAGLTHAQTPPQFSPNGAWEVQKTDFAKVRGLNGVKMPCMMAMKFDNGYVMRLSGGGGKMLAMAIDFRQNVFHQGRKYPASFSLNQSAPQDMTATAFSESTLIFNVRAVSSFYQGITNGAPMMLNIDGNAMIFSLGNIQDSLAELESCYGETPAAATPNDPKSALPTLASDNSTWQAKAGDDIQMTLQKWANRAGVKVEWQSDRAGKLVSDISVKGTFQDAVQQLMAQNSAAMGIEANMMGASGSQASRASQQPAAVSRAPQQITPPASAVLQSKWSAPAGADLQIVLQNWAAQENVDFVWQSNQNFRVKSAVTGGNSYEESLQSLLNQYQNDKVRPAAQLNNDPSTGRKTLIVNSSRVL